MIEEESGTILLKTCCKKGPTQESSHAAQPLNVIQSHMWIIYDNFCNNMCPITIYALEYTALFLWGNKSILI